MKGIVFSEFNEMVEEMFSPALADKIIMRSTWRPAAPIPRSAPMTTASC